MSSLRLIFYGTRGSLPVCDPKFLEFGGNTTCIAMHRGDNNKISILDAGTGIRKLGKDIQARYPEQDELFIGFTHFHWDHIQGFPFFDPAYNPKMKINILALGQNRKYTDLHEIFGVQMREVYFPIPLDEMGCQFNFLAPNDNQVQVNAARIQAIKQSHPGGSYGYRIEVGGKTLVICTDLEHGDEVNTEIVEFARNADLLIHEAQYTSEELKSHKGWGHSSYEQAIEVAERAEARQLLMTHHDPDHDDAFLRAIEKKCQDRFRDCVLAREGMVIEI